MSSITVCLCIGERQTVIKCNNEFMQTRLVRGWLVCDCRRGCTPSCFGWSRSRLPFCGFSWISYLCRSFSCCFGCGFWRRWRLGVFGLYRFCWLGDDTRWFRLWLLFVYVDIIITDFFLFIVAVADVMSLHRLLVRDRLVVGRRRWTENNRQYQSYGAKRLNETYTTSCCFGGDFFCLAASCASAASLLINDIRYRHVRDL